MIRLHVEGMSCEHCEARVRDALAGVSGVERVVSVDRSTQEALVEGAIDPGRLVAAAEAQGYRARVLS
ncbi:MAG: heavy-metal-associated domain-containing protein [Ectothiorhodospira sp.]